MSLGVEPCFLKYLSLVFLGDTVVEPFDYVVLNANEPNKPPYIAKVAYMWEDSKKTALFHAHLFCRGSDTILGETSDPRELFLVNVCENFPLGSIAGKAKVRVFE